MAYAHNLNYVVINSLEPLWTIVLTILLKVYSNELFFISTNERLMYKFYKKIVIILFLSKAVFTKRTLLFQYFVLKIEPP